MKRKSIVALLVSALVAVGVLVTACGLPGSAVAKVGNVLIDNKQFTSQVDSYASQYGITKASDPTSYKSLAGDVLESMIETQLAVQKAPSLGISVADAEVQAKIKSIVDQYYGGDQSALESQLKSESMTLDDLKKQVSNYLIFGKVHDAITKDAAAPTDAQISAYYDQNKADYQTDETVEARHILIPVAGRVVHGKTATTTQSTTATSSDAETTTTSTSTAASTTTTTLADLVWARALATAAQVRAELLSGGNWERLAARYSGDADTKYSGGNLGTVIKGSLVEALGQEFEDSLWSLELNQISEPIKTAYGYEIIQVTKITDPRQKTLEEAKADIAATLLSDAQDAAWQTWIDKVKLEIHVTYRSDMVPTTTTIEKTTTTVGPAETATTAAP